MDRKYVRAIAGLAGIRVRLAAGRQRPRRIADGGAELFPVDGAAERCGATPGAPRIRRRVAARSSLYMEPPYQRNVPGRLCLRPSLIHRNLSKWQILPLGSFIASPARSHKLSNRITLDALVGMKPDDRSAIPADELAMLSDDLDGLKADLRVKSAALTDALAAKYGAQAAARRKAAGADTGTVTVADGEFSIVNAIPKSVTWDQAKLSAVVADMIANGAEPAAYGVVTEYSVTEKTYGALLPNVRAAFEPARTVKPGTPTFKITAKGEK